ncbi:uncharacterized protein LOC119765677 [Culex quinquefasciatus]|uniref:uncharacterized protein LOC119765677 n=1 Tax=Culex quinquefasciatus TaxID=7176 RepID=UPI0018E3734D|nr:uncharacterized protein LOC119765677 [Culex quinquefasciatus]
MVLPKRCVNKEIALKKINFRFLDKYAKVYFHDGPPTKSYIIGGGQRRCCTRCRRFTAPQYPAHKHSRRDLDSEPKKICVILEVGLRAQNRTPFRGPHQLHVPDALPGSGTPRINGQLLQDCPD